MLDRQSIIEAGEKNGLKFVGSVDDKSSPDGIYEVEEFENEVVKLGGFIHSVVIGKSEFIFSGPNPNGSRFTHRLPRAKREVA